MTTVLIILAFLYLAGVSVQLILEQKLHPAGHMFSLTEMRRESRPLPLAEPRPATVRGFVASIGDQITLGRILISVGALGVLGGVAMVFAIVLHYFG